MKRTLILMLAGLVILAVTSSCKDQTPEPAEQQMPAAHNLAAQGKAGTVVETMNAGGYTYIQVDTEKEKIWAAAPEFQVKVGDVVVVPEGMAMPNHHSKTLNRDFDLVYFVNSVLVGGDKPSLTTGVEMPEGHPPINVKARSKDLEVDLSGIKKAEGGKTVAEIFSERADFDGKVVVVRGKVVRFLPAIMGKNWIHLRDGTGSEGTNDLTITTASMAKVGDTILVSGPLTLDKDFGFGYKYEVIIEDAKIVVE